MYACARGARARARTKNAAMSATARRAVSPVRGVPSANPLHSVLCLTLLTPVSPRRTRRVAQTYPVGSGRVKRSDTGAPGCGSSFSATASSRKCPALRTISSSPPTSPMQYLAAWSARFGLNLRGWANRSVSAVTRGATLPAPSPRLGRGADASPYVGYIRSFSSPALPPLSTSRSHATFAPPGVFSTPGTVPVLLDCQIVNPEFPHAAGRKSLGFLT